MNNSEVMVVLSDGKPVTVVRPRQSSSSRMAVDPGNGEVEMGAAAKAVHSTESKHAGLNRELRGKEFEEHIELKRLRSENRLLQQRIDNLEQVLHKRGDESCQLTCASCNNRLSFRDNGQELVPRSSAVVHHPTVDVSHQRVSDIDMPNDADLQRIQDELIACKLREAEANLTMKEFQHKVNQLERHWQQFLQENRGSHSESKTKSATQSSDLKDTVMALRLRETYLVCDLNTLKQRLMELETQNHIFDRQIKRQEGEHAILQETISVAELRQSELANTIVHLKRKLTDYETKGKEDAAMSRLKDAEHSQVIAEMRRRIAELEIENQELVTSARLQNRDSVVGDLESKIASELQIEAASLSSSRTVDGEAAGKNVDEVVANLDLLDEDVERFEMETTGSLLLSNNFETATF